MRSLTGRESGLGLLLAEQRQETTAVLKRLRKSAADGLHPRVLQVLERGFDENREIGLIIEGLRSEVDARAITLRSCVEIYTNLIASLSEFSDQPATVGPSLDRSLSDSHMLDAIRELKDLAGRQRAVVSAILSTGAIEKEREWLRDLQRRETVKFASARSWAGERWESRFENPDSSLNGVRMRRFVETLLAAESLQGDASAAARWWAMATRRMDELHEFENDVLESITSRDAEVVHSVAQSQFNHVVMLLVTVAVVAMLLWACFRSLSESFHRMLLLQDQAEESLRTKGEFLATMSHEIRTPMNGFVAYAELLERTSLNRSQRGYVEGALASARSLMAIVDDILDFAKLESGDIEVAEKPVEVRTLVQDLFDIASGSREDCRGVSAELVVEDDVPRTAFSDPQRIRQIVLNLLSNSFKFTKSGSVTLRLGAGKIEGAENRREFRFEVEDTGIGMSEAECARVFESFTQADASTTRAFGGTGLGLSICQRLAHLLGGTLELTSTLGKGTTIALVLPLRIDPSEIRESQAAPATPKAPATPEARGDEEILLVEDNRVNQMVARSLLKRLGIENVTLAENGQEALDRVEERRKAGDGFDLVLMDCRMPVMDGFEATRRLLEMGLETPIVALTANSMQGDREQCLEAGMRDYMAKPVQFDTFAEVVTRWTAGAPPRRKSDKKAPKPSPSPIVMGDGLF